MAFRSGITQARLKELVTYNPASGEFHWRVSPVSNVKAGDLAGWFHPKYGYHHIALDKVIYRSNRLAWLYMNGKWPRCFVDHKDGDVKNNRWSNLRKATRSQNQWNQRKQSRKTTSKYKGVSWHKHSKKWRAYIKKNGKTHSLGMFETEELAYKAYCTKAKELFGEYARI